MYGYSGKIVKIDLLRSEVKKYDLPLEWCKDYIGGLGFNTKILWDLLSPNIDPLSPENIIVFSPGVFVGTSIPTASRCEASAKSPITERFGTSNSGLFWGFMLKASGIDILIVSGKAEKLSYISIIDGDIKICNADHLKGLNCWDTTDFLRRDYGDVEVASIGPAGENMVRFASIENNYYDAWGRCGLGAVLGSKNVKAIIVRGDNPIKIANMKEYEEACIEAYSRITSYPLFNLWRTYGTLVASDAYSSQGILPVKNFQYGTIEGWENCLRENLHKYKKKGISCITCPIACAHWVTAPEGKFKGLTLKDLEVTWVFEFGAKLGITSFDKIMKCTEIASKLGLDCCSSASVIAWAFECFEKGILSENDTKGLKLNWGDEEAVLKLLEDIAYRRGIGNMLAEGVRKASQILGRGSEKYALHIKGLEIPFRDPRGRWGVWCFGYLTNTRGGDHLRVRAPVELFKLPQPKDEYWLEACGVKKEVIDELDMLEEFKSKVFINNGEYIHIPTMTIWSENLISIYNSVGLCIRPPVLGTIGPIMISKLYRATTGINTLPEEIITVADRIINMQKKMNIAMGETRNEYRYPDRFYNEAIPDGPNKGKKLNRKVIDEMVSEYFKLRGWDPETGKPKEEKLKELKIEQSKFY
ncbi:MAG: aldehyde ferredoxin oxidoreductase family protein [Candidatus Methanomethylicia archaeon]